LKRRQLILSHRHQVRARQENVGGLHHGIGEEGNRHALIARLDIRHLRLERRVAL
jgi:hypothetical protein